MDEDASVTQDRRADGGDGPTSDGSEPTDGQGSEPTDDQGSEPTDDQGSEPTDGQGTPGDSHADAGRDAPGGEGDGEAAAPGGRDVVVPLRMYKTVTVFSTLIAIAAILAGFVLLDRGTQRATASPDEVSLPVVALGLGLIVGGSAVYAFSTRFRTAEMGKSKDDTGEGSNNG